jgi:GH15 family glucan-1,4-alpha-glucosidase
MYRVDGSADLAEETLDHWEGYAGSRPVRIGNGAADQLQLDIYGEMLDSVYLADRHGIRVGHPGWTRLSQLTDWLCAHWDQPDEGVWETRGGRQNFTYGRLMCWVALDRMVRLAREHGRPADLARWITERDRLYQQIMQRGWNHQRKAFTQHDKTQVLDASLLMMPLVGFVAPTDPMWLSTLDAMDQELVSDSLVYRYDPPPPPTGCAATRAPSRSAPSGTWTPWPAPAGWSRRGWRSRRCSPTPTTWACTPRRSARPGSSWATSPRRSPTCRSSTRPSTSTTSSTTVPAGTRSGPPTPSRRSIS